ncbi:Uncharacterized acetyltransferase At3g50280 [Linum perenne]
MADDDKVRVLSTGLIQPATNDEQLNTQTSSERIPLTPCDLRLILIGTIQKGLLFRKPNPPQQNLIENLKSSFSRTLALFYPLAGRLSADEHPDGTASVYIDCNNAGALFVHAVADSISVADVLEPLYVPPVVWSFFPLNWVRSYHGFSQPFLAVQITELVDGIFVGCTISHATQWLTELPCGEEDSDSVLLKERVFHFSRRKLGALKAQANAEAIAGRGKISSLQTLISHIWRAVTRNRKNPDSDPDREATFHLLVGFRSRLRPKLPDNYFGNAVAGCAVVMKEKALTEKGLGDVAAEINKVVVEQTDDRKLKEAVESWIENPQMPTIGTMVKGGMGLSSSPRYDVYGNDFGWGKPVAVRSGAGNKIDGKVTVFPGVEEGSIDVEICLWPETAERLGRDSEFMAAVGV